MAAVRDTALGLDNAAMLFNRRSAYVRSRTYGASHST